MSDASAQSVRRRAGADWEAWRAELWRPPLDGDALAARLLALAPSIRARLRRSGSLAAEWSAIGIDVVDITMSARGGCSPQSGSRAIFVNADDRVPLQRFTVAHELAHLLLAAPQEHTRLLAAEAEEELCERFARTLLVPSEWISPALRADPMPEEILRLCGRSGVNVRPVLRAVGEELGIGRHHLMLARWGGHRRRPDEHAFRVAGAAGNPHVFIPFGVRLASIGFGTLDELAREADHLDRFDGEDGNVVVRLRGLSGERSSAERRGRVRWRAQRNGREDPLVVVVLDLADVLPLELGGIAYAPEMRRVAS